jgi:hypothetical protein
MIKGPAYLTAPHVWSFHAADTEPGNYGRKRTDWGCSEKKRGNNRLAARQRHCGGACKVGSPPVHARSEIELKKSLQDGSEIE